MVVNTGGGVHSFFLCSASSVEMWFCEQVVVCLSGRGLFKYCIVTLGGRGGNHMIIFAYRRGGGVEQMITSDYRRGGGSPK